MADSGGHWKNLAEAQKLTQSTLVPGVVETDIKRNNPLDRMPVAQAANSGQSIKWVREKTLTEDSVADIAIGTQLAWSEDVEYDEVTTELKIQYIQRKLDHFVRDIYGNFNNYRAQVLLEMEKGLKRKIGDKILYDDLTYGGAKQFDGLHALASENSLTSGLNIDEAGPLSLENLRDMTDAMLAGVDEIWVPYPILRRLEAAYEERGFVALADATAGALSLITRGISDIGKRLLFWNGIPLVPSDYLVPEEDGTGIVYDGGTARAKYTTTKTYSIFAVKFGNVMERDPGVCLAYGGTEGQGDFYKLVPFPELEDYDAEGMRIVSYNGILLGAKFCIGRIFDITDAAVVA